MFIDSHCHLNHDRLLALGQPADIVARARAAGVAGMLTVNCRIVEEFQDILSIARQFDNVWCSIGTHPHDASQPQEKAITLDQLIEMAQSDPKIIGIGESGLDYFYKHSSPEDQQESFRKHIRACVACDLPLIVHARDADEDVMRIIREEGTGTRLKGLLHCFSSGRKMAEDALDFGFYISFSGIVTFKKSDELRDIAATVPLDRLLVETDAPYLAPEPERGAINEPARVIQTAHVLAALHRVSDSQLMRQTTSNFLALFDKAVFV